MPTAQLRGLLKHLEKCPVVWIFHSLVEVCFLHSLLAPLQSGAVLVLQGLQVRHGLHALQLQTLVVVTRFGVGSGSQEWGGGERGTTSGGTRGASVR